jgi:hypothetical protein
VQRARNLLRLQAAGRQRIDVALKLGHGFAPDLQRIGEQRGCHLHTFHRHVSNVTTAALHSLGSQPVCRVALQCSASASVVSLVPMLRQSGFDIPGTTTVWPDTSALSRTLTL